MLNRLVKYLLGIMQGALIGSQAFGYASYNPFKVSELLTWNQLRVNGALLERPSGLQGANEKVGGSLSSQCQRRDIPGKSWERVYL